jgi:hypothetical protein
MHRKKSELSRPPGADEVQMTAGFILNVVLRSGRRVLMVPSAEIDQPEDQE